MSAIDTTSLVAELRGFAEGSTSARATLMRDAADAIERLQSGATDWEYAVTRASASDVGFYFLDTLEAAERFVANTPIDVVRYEDDPFIIIRRREAGSWETVSSHGDGAVS